MHDARERNLRRLFTSACALLLTWELWVGFTAPDVVAAASVNCDLGVWAMRFLIVTLALSPLSRWTRRPALKRWRRPLGLAAFAFTMAHAIHYVIYAHIWPDHLYILLIRPYLLVGVLATVLLLTLAATSTNKMVQRLSPKGWRRLHTIVYLALPLCMAHGLMAFWDPYGEAALHLVACIGLALARWGQGWAATGARWARTGVGVAATILRPTRRRLSTMGE